MAALRTCEFKSHQLPRTLLEKAWKEDINAMDVSSSKPSDTQTGISLWTRDFLRSSDSGTPLEPNMFSKQTAQPVQESRPGPKEPDTGIASDSCFLLCNYTQLLFLREGILVL